MGLNLPEYEQVVLAGSPLEEVVCQLRFPQILKIAESPPSEFQDRVRRQLPVFEQEKGIQIGMAGGGPVFATTNEPAWQFKSSDDQWIATLTSSFVALKTTAYRDFEDFVTRLFQLVVPFEQIYEAPFYTRVGLRYVNRLVAPLANDDRVEWGQILNQHLAGLYADPVFRDGVVEAKHHLVLETEHGQIGWRHSRDIGQTDGKPAERFTLDFDHYKSGQIACDDVQQLLIRFNDKLYRLFRWCLTDNGFEDLEPRAKPTKETQRNEDKG